MSTKEKIYVLDGKLSLNMISRTCIFCRHENLGRLKTCAAFPDEVPDEIWYGQNNHKKPYPGDHGIQFEKFVAESEEAKKTA